MLIFAALERELQNPDGAIQQVRQRSAARVKRYLEAWQKENAELAKNDEELERRKNSMWGKVFGAERGLLDSAAHNMRKNKVEDLAQKWREETARHNDYSGDPLAWYVAQKWTWADLENKIIDLYNRLMSALEEALKALPPAANQPQQQIQRQNTSQNTDMGVAGLLGGLMAMGTIMNALNEVQEMVAANDDAQLFTVCSLFLKLKYLYKVRRDSLQNYLQGVRSWDALQIKGEFNKRKRDLNEIEQIEKGELFTKHKTSIAVRLLHEQKIFIEDVIQELNTLLHRAGSGQGNQNPAHIKIMNEIQQHLPLVKTTMAADLLRANLKSQYPNESAFIDQEINKIMARLQGRPGQP